jgi:uncharacterized protein YjbI with pentapeptide repeats
MSNRLPYEASCQFLQQEGWLANGDLPQLPERPPRYDDDILGVEFFRTYVKDAKLDNLSLPRTYFSRSEISSSSFVNSNLSESVANWNDFEDVDFSNADLSRFDFRGCALRRVRFAGSLLIDADLRCCGFEDCDFTGANLTRTKLTREVRSTLNLTADQTTVIDWQDDDGPDPDGG